MPRSEDGESSQQMKGAGVQTKTDHKIESVFHSADFWQSCCDLGTIQFMLFLNILTCASITSMALCWCAVRN